MELNINILSSRGFVADVGYGWMNILFKIWNLQKRPSSWETFTCDSTEIIDKLIFLLNLTYFQCTHAKATSATKHLLLIARFNFDFSLLSSTYCIEMYYNYTVGNHKREWSDVDVSLQSVAK